MIIHQWQNPNYVLAKEVGKKLLVLNDTAERGISLITRFNSNLKHQEHQKQAIIHAILKYYKDLPLKTHYKEKFVDYLCTNFPN